MYTYCNPFRHFCHYSLLCRHIFWAMGYKKNYCSETGLCGTTENLQMMQKEHLPEMNFLLQFSSFRHHSERRFSFVVLLSTDIFVPIDHILSETICLVLFCVTRKISVQRKR